MDKIRIREAVVVEGRYDKIRLESLIDGLIITTDGFGIFRDGEKMNLLRHLAATRGLLVFTDSDGAGFLIRNRIKSCIPAHQLRHAYIPDVYGKERRKAQPSKEGKLGVEGMTTAVLLEALQKAFSSESRELGVDSDQWSAISGVESGEQNKGASENCTGEQNKGASENCTAEQNTGASENCTAEQNTGASENCTAEQKIDRRDFYRAGLSGGEGSAARRAELLALLGLPSRMTSNALLAVINDYMTRDEFLRLYGNAAR